MCPEFASQRGNIESFPGETGWESEQVGSPDAPSAYNHPSTFGNSAIASQVMVSRDLITLSVEVFQAGSDAAVCTALRGVVTSVPFGLLGLGRRVMYETTDG